MGRRRLPHSSAVNEILLPSGKLFGAGEERSQFSGTEVEGMDSDQVNPNPLLLTEITHSSCYQCICVVEHDYFNPPPCSIM